MFSNLNRYLKEFTIQFPSQWINSILHLNKINSNWLLIGFEGGRVILFDFITKQVIKEYRHNSRYVIALAYIGEYKKGYFMFADYEKVVSIWDIDNTEKPIVSINTKGGQITSLAHSWYKFEKSYIITGDFEGNIDVYDLDKSFHKEIVNTQGKEVYKINQLLPVNIFPFNLFLSASNYIGLWNIETGYLISKFEDSLRFNTLSNYCYRGYIATCLKTRKFYFLEIEDENIKLLNTQSIHKEITTVVVVPEENFLVYTESYGFLCLGRIHNNSIKKVNSSPFPVKVKNTILLKDQGQYACIANNNGLRFYLYS